MALEEALAPELQPSELQGATLTPLINTLRQVAGTVTAVRPPSTGDRLAKEAPRTLVTPAQDGQYVDTRAATLQWVKEQYVDPQLRRRQVLFRTLLPLGCLLAIGGVVLGYISPHESAPLATSAAATICLVLAYRLGTSRAESEDAMKLIDSVAQVFSLRAAARERDGADEEEGQVVAPQGADQDAAQ